MSETFAALAIGGGGMPPRGACDPCPSPIYYLMGDKNPLFDLAMETQAALARCGHAIDFHLLPGKNHAGEWRVYASREEQNRALDFLLVKRRSRCAPTAPASSSASVVPLVPSSSEGARSTRAPSVDANPDAVKPSSAQAGVVNEPPAPRGCACEAGRAESDGGPWALAALGVVVFRRRWSHARKLFPERFRA